MPLDALEELICAPKALAGTALGLESVNFLRNRLGRGIDLSVGSGIFTYNSRRDNKRRDQMLSNRFFTPILAAGLQVAAFCATSGALAAVVAPIPLPPGGTVSSLPNGYSSYPADPGITLFNKFIDFDFDDGLLSRVLRERVIQYSQKNEYHPYGGLYFDYEISLSSGDVAEFSAPGYAGYEVAVKQCGIAGCGGSGANGVSTTSASRTSDGNSISFFFDGDLSGSAHSANLQLLTNASSFVDPDATFMNAAGDVFSVPVLVPAGAPVPEPSTWAMMLLGFAGLGFAGYRKGALIGG
jgi:PEP-CTERM motif